jgi:hypothetical protein
VSPLDAAVATTAEFDRIWLAAIRREWPLLLETNRLRAEPSMAHLDEFDRASLVLDRLGGRGDSPLRLGAADEPCLAATIEQLMAAYFGRKDG